MLRKVNAGIAAFLKIWWQRPKTEREITRQDARKIQKQAYESFLKVSDKVRTPPYVLVAGQLSHEKQPIFEAAVYYLCTIAANEPKYKMPITDILKSYLQEHQDNLPRTAYLKQAIKKYKL